MFLFAPNIPLIYARMRGGEYTRKERRLYNKDDAASDWRIHCGVEVTELSTNKQHTLSLVYKGYNNVKEIL